MVWGFTVVGDADADGDRELRALKEFTWFKRDNLKNGPFQAALGMFELRRWLARVMHFLYHRILKGRWFT